MIKNYYWVSATYQHVFKTAEARDEALQFIVYESNSRQKFSGGRPAYFTGLCPDAGMFLIYCVNLGDFPKWAKSSLDAYLKIDTNKVNIPQIKTALQKWTPKP